MKTNHLFFEVTVVDSFANIDKSYDSAIICRIWLLTQYCISDQLDRIYLKTFYIAEQSTVEVETAMVTFYPIDREHF